MDGPLGYICHCLFQTPKWVGNRGGTVLGYLLYSDKYTKEEEAFALNALLFRSQTLDHFDSIGIDLRRLTRHLVETLVELLLLNRKGCPVTTISRCHAKSSRGLVLLARSCTYLLANMVMQYQDSRVHDTHYDMLTHKRVGVGAGML